MAYNITYRITSGWTDIDGEDVLSTKAVLRKQRKVNDARTDRLKAKTAFRRERAVFISLCEQLSLSHTLCAYKGVNRRRGARNECASANHQPNTTQQYKKWVGLNGALSLVTGLSEGWLLLGSSLCFRVGKFSGVWSQGEWLGSYSDSRFSWLQTVCW